MADGEPNLETKLNRFLREIKSKQFDLITDVKSFLNAKLTEAGKSEWIPILNLDEKLALLYHENVHSADNDNKFFKIDKSYISHSEYVAIYEFLKTLE